MAIQALIIILVVLLVLLVVSMLASGSVICVKAEQTAEQDKFTLSETVFPEKDAATGTLKFYFNGKEAYAGGPVSNLLDMGVTEIDDLDQTVEPWHMTGVIRVRVNQADGKKPFVFFVAMNTSNEPQKVSDCMIYSITINTADGFLFGSGKVF